MWTRVIPVTNPTTGLTRVYISDRIVSVIQDILLFQQKYYPENFFTEMIYHILPNKLNCADTKNPEGRV